MILSHPSTKGTDPLSDVLGVLGARSIRRTRLEAAGSWGLAFAAQDRLKFVAVVRGHAWAMLPGRAPLLLADGDVCLLGRTAYAVASHPGAALAEGAPLFQAEASEVVRLGGADTVMLGGGIAFTEHTAGFLFDALPPFLLLPASSGAAATTAWLLSKLEREATTPHPGSALVAARLAEILLVEAIRAEAAAPATTRPGWIAALADRQVGAALRLMHGDVAFPWTVQLVARRIGMSRSAFAARFLTQVGRPPMDYLCHWRMVLAQAALRSGEVTAAAVAERVGYASQSAFAQAYRRFFGYPPGRTRRDIAPPPPG
jgi:AraC-like DNA-binding protein